MADQKVTIIVPTFNRARYLPECLDSLLAQTYEPFEIIVVNDGSTDETASVIEPYLGGVEYIEKENGGKSSALNLVMPGIQSDYVWIFDDDDVAFPDALEIHVRALEEDPEPGFTYSAYCEGIIGPDGRLSKGPLHALPNAGRDDLFALLLEDSFIAHPASVVRSRCYREVGPFDTHLTRSQDYDMVLRLSSRFTGLRIDRPTYIYRLHDELCGISNLRLSHSLRHQEWFRYNQIIFEKLHARLSLSEYLPKHRRSQHLDSQALRETLLRRMSVMARKGLWHHAIRDIEELGREDRLQEPLSDTEKRLCRIAMESVLAIKQMLVTGTFLHAVRECCRGNGGLDMRCELARGLYYQFAKQVRGPYCPLAASTLIAIIRMLGPKGVVEATKFKLGLPSIIHRLP